MCWRVLKFELRKLDCYGIGNNSMSASSTDKGLLTPDNCEVIFIDHQPRMFFGVANIDRRDLLDNVLVLAKAVSRPDAHRAFQHECLGQPRVCRRD